MAFWDIEFDVSTLYAINIRLKKAQTEIAQSLDLLKEVGEKIALESKLAFEEQVLTDKFENEQNTLSNATEGISAISHIILRELLDITQKQSEE